MTEKRMSLNELLKLADRIHKYSEDDKTILRELARTDPDGLRLALENDPLIAQKISENKSI